MARATDEQYALLDAALEGARIDAEHYATIRWKMRHNVLSETDADGLLVWLALREQWSDADLDLPDSIIGELREQQELDAYLKDGWVMDNDVLKDLWECFQTAHRLQEKFEAEHERTMTENERAIAISLFIETRRNGHKPASSGSTNAPQKQSGGVQECPKCGGAVWDNRQKNIERVAEGKKPMPIFTCKDKDGCGWAQWPPKKDGDKKSRPVTVPVDSDEEDTLPF